MAEGRVIFIGAGPGDPKLLTIKGKEALEAADVVIWAGSLVNKEILFYARKDTRIIDSAELDLSAIAEEMISAVRAGRIVVRAHTGEPSLYGAIAEQIEILDKENIPFEIIPGVSSAFAAAASLHIEYTLPDVSQTLIFTRRSGRTPVPKAESLQALASHRASMVVFLSIGMLGDVVAELVQGGYAADTPAAVVYRASWPDEKKVVGTLATIAGQVQEAGISRQALILVGEAVGRNIQSVSKLYDAGFSHGFRTGEKKFCAVVAVTRRGWHTAARMMRSLDGADLFLPVKLIEDAGDAQAQFYDDIKHLIARIFYEYGQVVLVMASGIAVRLIAPHLASKWQDPAVVVIDDSGKNSISLLSGHWGGANDLAERLALVLGGNAVVTTESDVAGFPALDLLVKALAGGRMPQNKKLLKSLQARMLEGAQVGFCPRDLSGFQNMTGQSNLHFFDTVDELYSSGCTEAVIALMPDMAPFQVKNDFYVVPVRNIVAGIGCHKGISAGEIEEELGQVLAELHLSIDALCRIATVDKKRGEKGLEVFCAQHDLPLSFYDADAINRIKTPSAKSEHALRVMGVQGVAEPCAILGSQGGELLKFKVKLKNMTIAVARIPLRQLLEQNMI
jgi:precorrin-4 C11-methyltransferase